jgi:glycerol-3-phosphate acyltransferase PlsY
MAPTLANFAELLIMWFVPNLFFGWKVGGGAKLETYEKVSGQYLSPILAFLGTIIWLAFVNWEIYQMISSVVEAFFANLDSNYNAIVLLAMELIGYWVFKRQRLVQFSLAILGLFREEHS